MIDGSRIPANLPLLEIGTGSPALDGFDDLEALVDAPDASALKNRLLGALSNLAIDRYAYRTAKRQSRPADSAYITTYPNEWARHYYERGYGKSDPAVTRAHATVLPYFWEGEDGIKVRDPVLKRIYSEAADFGIRCGITIPIHSFGSQLSTFTITFDARPRTGRDFFLRYRHYLHLLALHYHAGIEALEAEADRQAVIRLTPRERECLSWTAQGKTAWEISVILSIAEDTVVFHLKNAMKKLGVHSKHHAVVKSITLGLITP
jgi:LuxR family transcriptional activator of conjugal transfer of Ti plasmids